MLFLYRFSISFFDYRFIVGNQFGDRHQQWKNNL